MSEQLIRFKRQKTLQNQVERLERRIETLEVVSRRYSWYRLAAILLGGLATWVAATQLSGRWGWYAFGCAAIIFLIIVNFQRRLISWIKKFALMSQIKSSHLARMNLNWVKIPEPPLPPDWSKSPLDIDLDLTGKRSLHKLLDVSVSNEGSQLLANLLSQTVPNLGKIISRQNIVRELIPMIRFRDRLILCFHEVSNLDLQGESLLQWLESEYPSSRLKWVLPVSTAFVVLNILLFILNILGEIPAYWTITLSIYIVFYYINVGMLNNFFAAIVKLDSELDKFRTILLYLETYPFGDKVNLSTLCQPFRDKTNPPSVQLRRIKITTGGVGLRMNPMVGILLNIILPWDFTFAYLANGYRESAAQYLPLWLASFYELEALMSLANYGYLNPDCILPEIQPDSKPIFEGRSLRHPLIPYENNIKNNFTVQDSGEITLITGSNMAGKSTFLKTVGINFCLAYAGGPVNASKFQTTPFRLHTCIRISDSITDGFSYFYAEVKCLKSLLEEFNTMNGYPLLYLIDEIFRGTNNRERLIGGRSYVKSLVGKTGVGFLATHDLELASLADGGLKIHNYHFRDSVAEGVLVFDYKIHPGPSPTTNALKIMRMEGLPVED
jgi:hypothetical protein